MLTAAADAIASFASGIGEQLPQLVPQALQMVVTLADAVVSNIPTIVNAGISLLTGLVQGIINALPTLISEGPRIINEFANAIYSAVGQLITTAGKLIIDFGKGLIDQIPLIKQHALDILMAIINVMSLSKMLSLGKKCVVSDIPGTAWSKDYSVVTMFRSEGVEECAEALRIAAETTYSDAEMSLVKKDILLKYSIDEWVNKIISCYGI